MTTYYDLVNSDKTEELQQAVAENGIDLQDSKGDTALYCAVLLGKNDIANMLLSQYHADPDLILEKVKKPLLDLAVSKHGYEMVKLLIKHGARIDSESVETAVVFAGLSKGNYSILWSLLECSEGVKDERQFAKICFTSLMKKSYYLRCFDAPTFALSNKKIVLRDALECLRIFMFTGARLNTFFEYISSIKESPNEFTKSCNSDKHEFIEAIRENINSIIAAQKIVGLGDLNLVAEWFLLYSDTEGRKGLLQPSEEWRNKEYCFTNQKLQRLKQVETERALDMKKILLSVFRKSGGFFLRFTPEIKHIIFEYMLITLGHSEPPIFFQGQKIQKRIGLACSAANLSI